MRYNLPLLRETQAWVLEQMERPAYEREFEMSNWRANWRRTSCGTTYCIAGHIAEVSPETEWSLSETPWVHVNGGREMHVADFAQTKLGLTVSEAGMLFHGGNADALRNLNKLIANAEACEREEAL